MKNIDLSDVSDVDYTSSEESSSDDEMEGSGIMRDNKEIYTNQENFNRLIDALGYRLNKSKEDYDKLKEENNKTLDRIKRATIKRVSGEVKQYKKQSRKINKKK